GPLRLSFTDPRPGATVSAGPLLVLSLRPGASGDESEVHREERVRCSGVSWPGLRASGSAPAAISAAEPGSHPSDYAAGGTFPQRGGNPSRTVVPAGRRASM